MVEIHFMQAVLVQRALAIAHALVGLACTAFCIACGTAPPCSDAQLKRYSNSVWRHHICVWFALTVSAVAIGVPTQQCFLKKKEHVGLILYGRPANFGALARTEPRVVGSKSRYRAPVPVLRRSGAN